LSSQKTEFLGRKMVFRFWSKIRDPFFSQKYDFYFLFSIVVQPNQGVQLKDIVQPNQGVQLKDGLF